MTGDSTLRPSLDLGVGPLLTTFDATGYGLQDPRELARRAEGLGFEHLWVGDHLTFHGSPWLESTLTLAAIGAVTSRAAIGFSVLLPAMRQHAWMVKQIGTLEHLFPGRLRLGIGVGGEGPEEWAAAGVPVSERGARTDALLSVLPQMLAGEAVDVPGPGGTHVPPMHPAPGQPPIWVGGRSPAALRRSVRYGDVWLGAFVDPRRVKAAGEQMAELSEEIGRPAPPIAVSAFVHVHPDPGEAERQAADYVSGIYGLPFEKMRRYVIIGDEEEVTRRLMEHVEAGVRGLTFVGACHRPWTQLDAFASVRERLLAACA